MGSVSLAPDDSKPAANRGFLRRQISTIGLKPRELSGIVRPQTVDPSDGIPGETSSFQSGYI